MLKSADQLHDRFPFLTYGVYLDTDYLGIVQNCDQQILSMFIYTQIHEEQLKKRFLIYGENWWWESNRLIPINVFFKDKFNIFKPFMKTFVRKEFRIMWGPIVSLQETMVRRIKRRQITLVKRIS
jgi:hypothetical protein